MKTVAFYTLGCKVNQYDSEAMLDEFIKEGFTELEADKKADVYVINTCVVTNTGERKSLQMVRRCRKINPEAFIIIAGCLAQREADNLLNKGADLVIGNSRRKDIVKLYKKALMQKQGLSAVESIKKADFEPLSVENYSHKTRAILKIQEGCDRFCTYCIIPYVRGGIRSRKLQSIIKESSNFIAQGYKEIVLTGIHLSSYGKDLKDLSLIDAIRAAAQDGLYRLRLGSLEPVAITEEFVKSLSQIPSICPQFHLSLQSGSDSVLKRMGRRYSTEEFKNAVALLRKYFKDPAITTDIICGFPGETEEEHMQSLEFVKEIQFAKVHVFPYSRRSGTKAAAMPEQIKKEIKNSRAHDMIKIGEYSQQKYAESFLNKTMPVLYEEEYKDGAAGYTDNYLRVETIGAKPNSILNTRLVSYNNGVFIGRLE
ncbi:MAG: tRNA (N(6)-L-threonylcarbamoyladenosine(37)-C(2))-methylthiotransferase MtaB [Eubacteriales bacterium]|nr:tRNA (N(6)-L-threonylcarbamoyladenosine(37)-C(2))-methylthiotransferase MtaB [Eubacteriales bacterium]